MVTHDPARRRARRAPAAPREGDLCRAGDRMKFIGLILKSARRSKRRTALTMISVALAVFLFSSLRAVLDGFDAVSAASSSTRLVTIRSTSMIFSMPTSHAEIVKGTPGVQDITWASWFGGIYKDPKNFFGAVRRRSRELPAHVSRNHPEPGGSQGLPRGSHRLHRRRRAGEEIRLQARRQADAAGRHSRCTDRRTSISRFAASITPAAPRSTTSR